MFISETQAYEDEIRTGLWEAGEFVEVRELIHLYGAGGKDPGGPRVFLLLSHSVCL